MGHIILDVNSLEVTNNHNNENDDLGRFGVCVSVSFCNLFNFRDLYTCLSMLDTPISWLPAQNELNLIDQIELFRTCLVNRKANATNL